VGRTLAFHAPPERVLSLVPSATEALVALGASGRLVGRTDFDTTVVLRQLPSVGGGLDPSLEAIVSLEPDLVIRFAAETDVRTPARLDELGISHLAVRPERMADVRTMLSDLGRISGRTAQADSILASIDATLERIREAVRGRPPRAVAFLLDGTPPWAAGPGTFIDELITTAGGRNVFADLTRPYAPVSPEELVARRMDVVLTPVGARPGGLPPGARVVEVPPSTQLPGPRLGEAALEIVRVLHPGALP
jgi:iron complex transport system substrate-binding protein